MKISPKNLYFPLSSVNQRLGKVIMTCLLDEDGPANFLLSQCFKILANGLPNSFLKALIVCYDFNHHFHCHYCCYCYDYYCHQIENNNSAVAAIQVAAHLYTIRDECVMQHAFVLDPDTGSASIVMNIENPLSETVAIQWQEDGEQKAVFVPTLGQLRRELSFEVSRPGSLSPIEFTAFKQKSKDRVDLNGFESIVMTPSIDAVEEKIVVLPKAPDSFIIVNFVNNRKEPVEVVWKQGDVLRTLLVHQGSERMEEIRFHGKQARALSFRAVTNRNGTEQRLSLNKTEAYTLYPSKEKDRKTLVIGKDLRFLHLVIANLVAGDIDLVWKSDNEIKEFRIRKGKNEELDLAVKESQAVVTLRAELDGLPVTLNGNETLQLIPSEAKTSHRIVAKRAFYLYLDVQNEAPGDVIFSWRENGIDKKLEILSKDTASIKIVIEGPNANAPITFTAVLKATGFPVLLNDQANLYLVPISVKRQGRIILSSYRLQLFNLASNDVMAVVKLGPDVEMIKIPFGRTRVTDVKFDNGIESLKFSGYNTKTFQKIRFNESVDYTVHRDMTAKRIQIFITDGRQSMIASESLLCAPYNIFTGIAIYCMLMGH